MMAEKAFPDIKQKLNAPVRKTAFERQKEEAEAKRKREEAETAAALKEFQDSFAEEPEDEAGSSAFSGYGGSRGRGLGFRGGMMGGLPPRGGFGSGMGRSGPGSLPPQQLMPGRKRGHDGTFAGGQQGQDRRMFSYSDRDRGREERQALRTGSDSEDDAEDKEKAAPRQTLHLADLPIGTTQEEIISLLQEQTPQLKVEKVEILPPPAPNASSRKSLSAVVTMVDGTVNREVEAAITALQKLYLGLGHRLSISKHLSTTLTGTVAAPPNSAEALPFGAKVLELEPQQPKMRYNMAAPPSEHRSGGFTSQTNHNLPSTVYVKVPTDLRQLKLINKTIEGLIKIGPEFEAALMQRPEVRSEERWSWLFDSTSTAGVYFRWRLWYLTSGRFNEQEEERNEAGTQAPEVVFRDEAPWQAPDRRPRFERVSQVDEFLSDPEYDEDEEEYSDNEESKKAPELNLTGEASEAQYLNPLHRARLTHLLARLPTSPAMLRKGDVARVSAFAYRHAGNGAEEIAHMLACNVAQPLSLTDANPENHPYEGIEYVEDHSSADENDGNSDYEPPEDIMPTTEKGSTVVHAGDGDVKMEDGQQADTEKEDTTSAKLVGLYVISDMLHGCDTAGVRNAWKYKSLIEKSFREQKIFEQLGRMERDMGWGRVKADRWKSRVMNLLDIWAGWSLYSTDTMQKFIDVFKNPPLTEEEKAADEKERKEREARRKAQKAKPPIAVRQSSETVEDEQGGARSTGTPKRTDDVEKSETDKMDVDMLSKAEDTRMDDEDDFDGDQSMFGTNGASEERPTMEEVTKAAPTALKPLASRGSQRPSTREMIS